MSIEEAWRFIQKVREDRSLRATVEEMTEAPDVDQLVRLGSEHGFRFTAEDLRAAHQRDWVARSIRSRSGPPSP